MEGFTISLIAIALAELGDKTQLSILLLASGTKRYFRLLMGVVLAFLVVDGVAILAGEWIARAVPDIVVGVVAGCVFVVFGLLLFFRKEEKGLTASVSGKPFASGFMLIFLSEWGDKSQIATGLFATQYNGFFVLAGAMVALFALSAAAIYLGRLFSDKLNPTMVAKAAGMLFVVIGIVTLMTTVL